jgi:hypothetical protein
MDNLSQLLHCISQLLILSPHFPHPSLDAGWRLLPFFWRDRTFGWGVLAELRIRSKIHACVAVQAGLPPA